MTLRRPPQTPKKAEFWGRFAQRLKCIYCKEIVDFMVWETTVLMSFELGNSGGLRKPRFKSLYYKEIQYPVQMIRPALRDWHSIFASVQKYCARVSQGKIRRKLEPAAVHGGNVKVLGWFLGSGCTLGLGQQQYI